MSPFNIFAKGMMVVTDGFGCSSKAWKEPSSRHTKASNGRFHNGPDVGKPFHLFRNMHFHSVTLPMLESDCVTAKGKRHREAL